MRSTVDGSTLNAPWRSHARQDGHEQPGSPDGGFLCRWQGRTAKPLAFTTSARQPGTNPLPEHRALEVGEHARIGNMAMPAGVRVGVALLVQSTLTKAWQRPDYRAAAERQARHRWADPDYREQKSAMTSAIRKRQRRAK